MGSLIGTIDNQLFKNLKEPNRNPKRVNTNINETMKIFVRLILIMIYQTLLANYNVAIIQ